MGLCPNTVFSDVGRRHGSKSARNAGVWAGDPYCGLQEFDVEHERIFHSRINETFNLLRRLRKQEPAGCAFASAAHRLRRKRNELLPSLSSGPKNPRRSIAVKRRLASFDRQIGIHLVNPAASGGSNSRKAIQEPRFGNRSWNARSKSSMISDVMLVESISVQSSSQSGSGETRWH